MSKLIELSEKTAVALYVMLEIFCISIGMGVPILCILLGFPVGWYITKRSAADISTDDYAALSTERAVEKAAEQTHLIYKRILQLSFWTSGFTFILLVIIWGRTIPMLFDPLSDFQNFGHPFILYDPKISFIAWLILMIFISPFLQLLTTIFAAFMTLMRMEVKITASGK